MALSNGENCGCHLHKRSSWQTNVYLTADYEAMEREVDRLISTNYQSTSLWMANEVLKLIAFEVVNH
jgi:hypothetical protein